MGDVGATYGATQSAVAGVAGTIGVGITAYVRTTYYVTEAHDRAPGQGAESGVRVMSDFGATYRATQRVMAGVEGTVGGGMQAYVRATYGATQRVMVGVE